MKKKVFMMMSVLLSFGFFCACSSNDDLEGMGEGKGNAQESVVDSVHFFQDIKAPYIPISDEDIHEWLNPYIENSRKGHVNMTVLRGRKNWEYVYLYQHFSMNRFLIDLKEYKQKEDLSVEQALHEIGKKHRIEIFGA